MDKTDCAWLDLSKKLSGENISIADAELALPGGQKLDARIQAARVGGRECIRPRHLDWRMSWGGWARGKKRRIEITPSAMAFCINAEWRKANPGPLFIEFDLFDQGYPFIWLDPSPLTEQRVQLANNMQWRKIFFRLAAGEESFRLMFTAPVYVARVCTAAREPVGYLPAADASARFISTALAGERPGMQVHVGNMGAIENQGDWPGSESLLPWLPLYKNLGVSAVQSYVKWSRIERQPGIFDWSFYDWVVETLAKHGLKWVIFVMVGQHYSTPDWFRASDQSVFTRCLEHGQESQVQSIWNPHILKWVDRFLGLLSERYLKTGMIEAMMLGPSGDYGETIFNAVYGVRDAAYHTHVGYWCGDRYARADFRRWLQKKYGALSSLRKSWGWAPHAWEDIQPFLREEAPSPRAWLDLAHWYEGSMTDFSASWASLARKHFPAIDIYQAAGGSGDLAHGADWTAQAKACSPHDVGLRVTNEGSSFAFDFAYTRQAASACRFYGVKFGNEPWGGDVSAVGNLARMFNAITSGARHFWIYSGHLHTDECIEAFRRFRHLLEAEQAHIDVAVYWPETQLMLEDDRGFGEGKPRSPFWKMAEDLRDLTDYDFVDATSICDGALRNLKFLLWPYGQTAETTVLRRVCDWVRRGGVLIAAPCGVIETVEGDHASHESLFAGGRAKKLSAACSIKRVGRGATVLVNGRMKAAAHSAFLAAVSQALRQPALLGRSLRHRIEPDARKDGVFASVVDGAVLYLNTNARAVQKPLMLPGQKSKRVVVPGFSILRVDL
jgi:hypothetical protein